MTVTEDIGEKLLIAFEWNDRDWHTAREVQRGLQEGNEFLSIHALIEAVEILSKEGYLDVVFTAPEQGEKTGFAARLTIAGRKHLRNNK
jgi:hypothetical protein